MMYFCINAGLRKRVNLKLLAQSQLFSTKTSTSSVESITVIAKNYYVAREIDIMKISGPFFANAKRDYQKKSVILTLNESLNQHISVFKYGSVVLFNIPNENHLECLNQIKDAATVSISDDEPRFKDDYKIVVNDKLDKPSVVKAEHLNIRVLDKNNITIGA